MRRLAFIGVVALAAHTGLSAQTKSLTPVQQEVNAADQRWAELYQGCNADGMSQLVADDLVFVHANGIVQNKTQFVDSVKPCVTESMKNEPSSLRVFGTTAIVVGTMTFKIKGMTPGVFMYTRTYVKDNAGKWRLEAHASSPVTNPAPLPKS